MDAPSQRENFNHPSTICRTYGAGRNTLSILRINPPKFGGGLKFEPDTEIGEKGGVLQRSQYYGTTAGNIKKERENLIANPLDLLFISGRGERI